MNIGIDARLLSTKIRGTSRYLSNVVKYIPQYDNKNNYYIFQYEDISQENKFYNYIPIKKSKLPRQLFEHYWLNFILPKHLLKNKIDIFFTPYVFVPFLKGNWKNVIVIHDALTKTCKEYYTLHYRKYMDFLVPQSIKRSDSIVTISKSAKQDIIKYYNVSSEKVQFMHLWTDEKYKPITISKVEKNNLLLKYNLPSKFVLFISVLEERKNVLAILKISDILTSKGINIKFVLIGRKGFGYQKISTEFQKRKDKIIHIESVIEEDLVLLYNLATIFIFPTNYEGFGLPVLEAMKCGLPVIASDNSSIPEIIGNAGMLGNSKDYKFFADSIISLLNDEKLYLSMKLKAIERGKKFTSEDHLTKLINIFNGLN